MALVLVHKEHGVFLGIAIGMAFWSKLDPVGQPSAPTFDSEAEVEEAMSTWLSHLQADKESLRTHSVVPDDGHYASVAACVRAGLEGWQDECTPVANEQPC